MAKKVLGVDFDKLPYVFCQGPDDFQDYVFDIGENTDFIFV